MDVSCPPKTSPTSQEVSPVNTADGNPVFTPKKPVGCTGFAVRSDLGPIDREILSDRLSPHGDNGTDSSQKNRVRGIEFYYCLWVIRIICCRKTLWPFTIRTTRTSCPWIESPDRRHAQPRLACAIRRVASQVSGNTLFYSSRKLRHRPYQISTVHSEHNFFEHRKRNLAAGFPGSERAVVVEADADGDGESSGAGGGAYKENIPEDTGRSRLSHNADGEILRGKRMSCAGGQAHDTAQTFLNERERGIVDRDLRPAVFVINRHLPRIADDPPDPIRLGGGSRCHGGGA